MGYTKSFTKGFDASVEIKIMEDDRVTNATFLAEMLPGKPTRKFGGDWLGVPFSGSMMIEKEKIDVRFLELYDLNTLRLHHSVDLSDESVTSYQWTNVPISMRVGQKLKVGTVMERDSSGKTLSSGDVEFILSKLSGILEFCTLETVRDIESKEQEITKDCDLFDSNKRIVGTSVQIKLGPQSTTTGIGKIRFK